MASLSRTANRSLSAPLLIFPPLDQMTPQPDSISGRMRLLDANANRASEGLRTLEDTARFLLNSSAIQSNFKFLRHELAEAMARIPRNELLAARDPTGDVGTTLTTASEGSRPSDESLVAAAASRTQQGLRCLEEYGKLTDAVFASTIESIRYRVYEIAARLELLVAGGNDRCRRLQRARLYALMDGGKTENAMVHRIEMLADWGVDIIQLRDHSVDDRTLFTRAKLGTQICRRVGVLWIVNDRADVASAADADGVHVGQDELPVAEVRRIVGPDKLVGLSTHTIGQVQDASRTIVDYIGCGPTFPGKTKSFDHYPGCDFLREVARLELAPSPLAPSPSNIDPPSFLPAFAIGGITVDNVDQVAHAGFARIAFTQALAGGIDADEGRRIAQRMRLILHKNAVDID